MQRRQHAEELLQWKRRLDAEEAEIRQIEKQALAAWDKELLKAKANIKVPGDEKSDQKGTKIKRIALFRYMPTVEERPITIDSVV